MQSTINSYMLTCTIQPPSGGIVKDEELDVSFKDGEGVRDGIALDITGGDVVGNVSFKDGEGIGDGVALDITGGGVAR